VTDVVLLLTHHLSVTPVYIHPELVIFCFVENQDDRRPKTLVCVLQLLVE
jgi:hypothetical protein